jgi:uncharacterized protein YdhG (YjbR/CyaY superfamily)
MTVTAANASSSAATLAANQPTTVGAYLRDLPPDRRVAMARVCSMIRRSARGVRESMRYGLAFYELDGPLFALESGKRHMSLFVAEQEVVVKHKDAIAGVDVKRSFIKFSDLNRLPLDVVEKIVRDSVAARRVRAAAGTIPTQAELLKLWSIKEEAATPPPPRQTISLKPSLPPPPPPEPIGKGKAVLKSVVSAAKPAAAPAKSVAKAPPATPLKVVAKAAAKPIKAAKAAKSAARAPASPAAKKAAKPGRAAGRTAARR